MKYLLRFKYFETVDNSTLQDMKYFGLSKSDIDEDGYVTLYHGGKNLPDKLNKDEIFFMTPDIELAKDYAKMRKGEVFTIKVKPEYVNWNQGSQEVELDGGGIIRNGIIIPEHKEQEYLVKSAERIKESTLYSENINIDIFKWIERTINYYLKTMNYTDAYDKLIEDIEYFENLDEENNEYIEFAKELKYDDLDKFHKDLRNLSTSIVLEDLYEENN